MLGLAGEIIPFLVVVAIGAAVGAFAYTMTALLADVPFSVGELLKATFVGAASAAVTFGIGTAAGNLFTNFFSRAAFQALAHGMFQGTMSGIQGGKFFSSFVAGALSSIAASAFAGGSSNNSQGQEIYNTGMKGLGAGMGNAGMIAFGSISGGAGAAMTGGNFWQGAVTGLVVSGLNHAMHKMQEKATLDGAIRKAGFDPDDVARWSNEELTTNMSKIFPDLYDAAGKPRFEIQDVVGGKDNIYGQAQKDVTGSPGNYKVVSKGLIYIKKLAINTVRHVASVAGHEMNHMVDYVNGNYSLWANQYGINGFKYANARSEIGAYGWEMGMGSPHTNYSELMLNYAKMTTNNWKF